MLKTLLHGNKLFEKNKSHFTQLLNLFYQVEYILFTERFKEAFK